MTNINAVANVEVPMKKRILQYGYLATVLLIALFVYLGFWQIDRYHQKQTLQQNLAERFNLPIIHKITNFDPGLRYRQLQVTGHFVNERQIYLDNQIVKGQVGYRVITPFQIIGQSDILLVDRGWIPLGISRDQIPTVKPLLGQQTLTGTINLPTNGLKLVNIFKKTTYQHTWPYRAQYIDFTQLASRLSQNLYPFIVQLNPQDPMGFNIQPITFNPPPSRHMGYAIQWFAMALVLFILLQGVRRN